MFIYTRCQCSKKPRQYKFTDKQVTSFEARLKLIAVKTRIQILLVLADSPHCVCDISAHTKFSQSLVSHHLADLMDACFVGSKKEGKYVEYFLNENGRELLKAIEHISACCPTDQAKGGDGEMTQDTHDCGCEDKKEKHCDGGECCQEEAEMMRMSKEELLAKKSKLEHSLKMVTNELEKK